MASVFEIDSEETAALSRDGRSDHGRVVTIPICELLSSDSPRLSGVNSEHARLLAESAATLPPIIVDRATLRVIDGMHRLRAAALRGKNEIEVQFFKGEERDAFVLAVEANIAHGLPLALSERTAAAARIITSHPEWSDRMIGSKTGLAAKTVRSIRRRSTEDSSHSSARTGRDGRVRPLNTTEGRKVATELLKSRPHAPLREIATAAGISLGTAQDVRKRLRRGEDPVLPAQRGSNDCEVQSKSGNLQDRERIRKIAVEHRALLLKNLSRDPSLSYADTGRILLRLLNALAIGPKEWEHLINNIPAHCRPLIRDAAHACADTWQELAARLDER